MTIDGVRGADMNLTCASELFSSFIACRRREIAPLRGWSADFKFAYFIYNRLREVVAMDRGHLVEVPRDLLSHLYSWRTDTRSGIIEF